MANADIKTKPTDVSVDDFINSVENPGRREDAFLLKDIMADITGETPTMWGPSIIGYGTYHYKYDSGREGDMLAVGFSPRKANMVCYVMGVLGDKDPRLQQLGKHKIGKSCLYLGRLSGIDMDVLKEMIADSYQQTIERYGAIYKADRK